MKMRRKNFSGRIKRAGIIALVLLCCVGLKVSAAAPTGVPTIDVGTGRDVVTGLASGTGWSFSGGVISITASGTYVLTGTTTTNRVNIATALTVTIWLSNLNMTSSATNPPIIWNNNGGNTTVNTTFILSGVNYLINTQTGTGNNACGIQVPGNSASNNVTFDGDPDGMGILYVTCHYYCFSSTGTNPSFTFIGGTIYMQTDYSGGSLYVPGGTGYVLNGGSLQTVGTTKPAQFKNYPQNGSKQVSQQTVGGYPAFAPVRSVKIYDSNGNDVTATYDFGINGLFTDANGNFYPWLPTGFRIEAEIGWTVKYDANGGSNPPIDTNQYAVGDPITLKPGTGMTPPPGGYVFAGWSLSPGGPAVASPYILDSSVATVNNVSITFYAIWKQVSAFGGYKIFDPINTATPVYTGEMEIDMNGHAIDPTGDVITNNSLPDKFSVAWFKNPDFTGPVDFVNDIFSSSSTIYGIDNIADNQSTLQKLMDGSIVAPSYFFSTILVRGNPDPDDSNATFFTLSSAVSFGRDVTLQSYLQGSGQYAHIDATTTARHLSMTTACALTLNNVTLNGKAIGGGITIDATAGNATLTSAGGGVITNCYAAGNGGGIYYGGIGTISGTLTISNLTISGNSAANGGGIYAEDYNALTVNANVIFSGNTAGTPKPWMSGNTAYSSILQVYNASCPNCIYGQGTPPYTHISDMSAAGYTLGRDYDNLFNNYDINFATTPVTYYPGNGGVGDPVTLYSLYGKPYTMPDNTFFTPQYGYTEKSPIWNTVADGTGVAYNAGDIISAAAMVNPQYFYAQWNLPPIVEKTVNRSAVNVGDSVIYTITAQVPYNIGNITAYAIQDQLDASLDFMDCGSLVAAMTKTGLSSGTPLSSGHDYTVLPLASANGGPEVIIELTQNGLDKLSGGDGSNPYLYIQITLEAKVNPQILNSNPVSNQATAQYSCDKYGEVILYSANPDDPNSANGKTDIHTAFINITKTDATNANKMLSHATFKIASSLANATAGKFLQIVHSDDGRYAIIDVDAADYGSAGAEDWISTSDDSGVAAFNGIADYDGLSNNPVYRTYYIVETAAPEGYLLPAAAVPVTFTESTSGGTNPAYILNVSIKNTLSDTIPIRVNPHLMIRIVSQ